MPTNANTCAKACLKHGNTADGRTRCRLKRLSLQTASQSARLVVMPE
ncbi:TPA: hypothetical protein ACTC2W_000586 [Neisseria meningitidis]